MTPSDARTRLIVAGRDTRGYETNLTRLPLFRSSHAREPHAGDDMVVGSLYGSRILVSSSATIRDGFLLMELCSRFFRMGCPPENRVEVTLADAARVFGSRCVGGSQRRVLARSLLRLQGISVQCTVRRPDGSLSTLTGGLVSRSVVSGRGRADGFVELSTELATLIRAGMMTLTHAPTALRLLEQDEYAWRLWAFLEGETISRRWSYRIFEGSDSTPAIVDLLRIAAGNRHRALRRVGRAVSVVVSVDRRYRISLAKHPNAGWCIEVTRSRKEGHPSSRERGSRGSGNGQPVTSNRALGATRYDPGADPPSDTASSDRSLLTVVPPRRYGEMSHIGDVLESYLPDQTREPQRRQVARSPLGAPTKSSIQPSGSEGNRT